MSNLGIKALFFDVLGTLVDYRTTLSRNLHARAQHTLQHPSPSTTTATLTTASSMTLTDWTAFTSAWDARYNAAISAFAAADSNPPAAFAPMPTHTLAALRAVLASHNLTDLWTEQELADVNALWRRLDAFPDSATGLAELRSRGFAVCALSNASRDMLGEMAPYAGLEFDRMFGCDDWGTFKPARRVFLGAAARMGLMPRECGKVSAHLGELKEAWMCGFRAVYVQREGEEEMGEQEVEREREEGWVDVWVGRGEGGIEGLAGRLGVCEAG